MQYFIVKCSKNHPDQGFSQDQYIGMTWNPVDDRKDARIFNASEIDSWTNHEYFKTIPVDYIFSESQKLHLNEIPLAEIQKAFDEFQKIDEEWDEPGMDRTHPQNIISMLMGLGYSIFKDQ